MKKLIISILALSTFGFLPLSESALAKSEEGKITAQANEFTYVAPDTVTISFSVETVDKNSQKAVELNNIKVTKLIEALKKELAENEAIKTSSYNLHQKYEYNSTLKKNIEVGFEVSNSISVKLKDTQKAGKIIDVATKNGVTTVSGLNFELQNTDIVCKELTQKAVIKAQKEAQMVLEPLGKKVASISTINYGCSTQMRYSPYRNFAMLKSSGADAAPESAVSIEEGETRVDANVTIVFTIK